ncbi:MAG: DUF5982 domain-containing protein [Bacteroidales bacterium]
MNKALRVAFAFGLFTFIISGRLMSQTQTRPESDSTDTEAKSGLNLGLLPVVGYNSDIGFQYGGIVNLFNYGDGSLYPEYRYSVYAEVSRTTKGSGVNQLFFDSWHLLPHDIRITADLSYLTELALDFYGFDGYTARYRPGFETTGDAEYISRMFYRVQRKLFRFSADFQGGINGRTLRWFGGISWFDVNISNVNIEKLNKGKDPDDMLPDTTSLYDHYTGLGLIPEVESTGGPVPGLKAGLIYDTRDNEPAPNKGIWSEAILFYCPEIAAGQDYHYLKVALTYRQYFSLVPGRLVTAVRLGYQGTIAGQAPWFMEPYMITSFPKATTTDGLGGAKTLRGILRNRVVGSNIALGNVELRWKFLKRRIQNQNLYLAANLFADGGQTVGKYHWAVDPAILAADYPDLFTGEADRLHMTYGAGLRIAMNENFIIAVDWGHAVNSQDGKSGLYIGIGHLF